MTLCVTCPEGHSVPVAADNPDRAIICPCCFAVFHAESDYSATHHARKEEKNTRRSRDDDDDDDDEEDEKPKKKKPAAKPKAKAETPKQKEARPAKKASREDEDEDDEEEEDEEEEAEIDWTPRKRQLNLCVVGLNITIGAFATMILFTIVTMLWLDYCQFGVMNDFQATRRFEDIQKAVVYVYGNEIGAYIAGPFFALTQIILLVGLFFSLSVPAKAEARSLALSGIVFGFVFFVFGILALLAAFHVVVDDPIRAERMIGLMGGAGGLCFILSLFSTMAFQAKLMMFMNLKLEASQAVTNVGFYFVFLAGMLAVLYASLYICNYLHPLLGWILIVAICAGAGMAGRTLYAQIVLMLKLSKTINTYIKEAV